MFILLLLLPLHLAGTREYHLFEGGDFLYTPNCQTLSMSAEEAKPWGKVWIKYCSNVTKSLQILCLLSGIGAISWTGKRIASSELKPRWPKVFCVRHRRIITQFEIENNYPIQKLRIITQFQIEGRYVICVISHSQYRPLDMYNLGDVSFGICIIWEMYHSGDVSFGRCTIREMSKSGYLTLGRCLVL